MKQFFRIFLSVIVIALFSQQALAECSHGEGPIIPDGNVASQDELVAAQKAMKAFQADLVTYRECLVEEESAVDPEAADAAEQTAAIGAKYDASVDAEEQMAAEFNAAVRAFKARQ
ncbi:MAG: hypothetical protein AAF431_06605 [Pseudomonadota bacterium]